ncbi:hypothetical protein M422DRAFT_32990 [Sphaerobolus stellatus SS14]|uniref:Small ribosomal subunit protein uS7 domain-containing protein n=1 Tax=Sphaerobolus stellatus (strain SS14) TaxID=990650 RepID=A0A0C9VMP3_SPHS4|nr:hypothetical protein M422DRAFT_32990 [Sphaerobolus stellatus SS14]
MLPKIRCGIIEVAHSCRRPYLVHGVRSNSTHSDLPDFNGEPVPLPPSLAPTESALAVYRIAQAARVIPPPLDVPPESDPLLAYLTNRIMEDGKRHTAEKRVSRMLLYLYGWTRAAPFPIFRRAVELTSPSVRLVTSSLTRTKSVQVPIALSEKQRTYYAITWLLDASTPFKKLGKTVEERLARTVLDVVRAELPAGQRDRTADEKLAKTLPEPLRKKWNVHHQAMVNRSNVRDVKPKK